jgi:hypothetical protein
MNVRVEPHWELSGNVAEAENGAPVNVVTAFSSTMLLPGCLVEVPYAKHVSLFAA